MAKESKIKVNKEFILAVGEFINEEMLFNELDKHLLECGFTVEDIQKLYEQTFFYDGVDDGNN